MKRRAPPPIASTGSSGSKPLLALELLVNEPPPGWTAELDRREEFAELSFLSLRHR